MYSKVTSKVVFFLFISFTFINCSKTENIPADVAVNDFVWKGMNAYYYWQNNQPDLADTRFSSQNQLNTYLTGFSTPENLFETLRYQPGTIDRFSWIVDDYLVLENSFQGITLNNGMEFNLYLETNSNTQVYAVVRYIIPGSDAANKGVLRGMVFNAIDGNQLSTTNYRELLFGSNTSYVVNFAEYNSGNPTSNGDSKALTKTELQENPVAIAKIFDEGTSKIGYLLYNQFIANFDDELNAAFASFKSENINDLIIDLRYNGGGSVRSATYLGSMVTGQFHEDLYTQEVWNEKVMEATPADYFLNNFTNQINNGIVTENINSVGLARVYFIVTGDTASASELVLNALSAYIEVNLVGSQTVGKQVGSITLYDSDNLQRTGANLNQDHRYAMQPIVLEIKNANGENNPNGYIPGEQIVEDFGQISGEINLGVLGEKSDPLLDKTITLITSGSRTFDKINRVVKKEQITNSKLQRPFSNDMYVEDFN